MGEGLAEADPRAEAIASVVRPHVQVSLGRGVARAEDHDLRVEIEDARERREDDVGALLLIEARDDADERHVGSLREPELRLQRALARGLSREIARVVSRGERGVGGRIPHRLVDAVQDADEIAAAEVDEVLEPRAAGRAADPLRVGGRDGRELGRVEEAPLERIDRAHVLERVGAHLGVRGRASRRAGSRGTSTGGRGCGW